MKKLLLLPLLLLLAVSSCKEKEYDCIYYRYYVLGCRIAFDGYLPQEVDSIQWFSYKAGTHFSEPPIDSQWIYTDSFTVIGSEVYKRTSTDSGASFVELKLGLDYRIITPFQVHTITDIQVGPAEDHYTRIGSPCGGGSGVSPFQSLIVDGTMIIPEAKSVSRYSINCYYTWLQKP